MRKVVFIVCIITAIVMIFFITNLITPETIIYKKNNALENLDVAFQFERAETKELLNEIYSLVYFKYSIKNHHNKKLYFHPGKIRVRYNGVINTSTEYDSIASAVTETVELPKGDKDFFLYLVFKHISMDIKIDDFKIIDTGLSENPGE